MQSVLLLQLELVPYLEIQQRLKLKTSEIYDQ